MSWCSGYREVAQRNINLRIGLFSLVYLPYTDSLDALGCTLRKTSWDFDRAGFGRHTERINCAHMKYSTRQYHSNRLKPLTSCFPRLVQFLCRWQSIMLAFMLFFQLFYLANNISDTFTFQGLNVFV